METHKEHEHATPAVKPHDPPHDAKAVPPTVKAGPAPQAIPPVNSPWANPAATFFSVPFSFNELLSDGDDIVSRPGTIAAGFTYLRGQILHYNDATQAISAPVVETDCNCILSNDTDTTGGQPLPANVYVSGKFKSDAVIWPAALSHFLIDQNLRVAGLFLENVVTQAGTLAGV
jgi:hypothetical protein